METTITIHSNKTTLVSWSGLHGIIENDSMICLYELGDSDYPIYIEQGTEDAKLLPFLQKAIGGTTSELEKLLQAFRCGSESALIHNEIIEIKYED